MTKLAPSSTPVSLTVVQNPWQELRQLTAARIALGRAGTSLPTDVQLEFQFAHARARDAVHLPLDTGQLVNRLQQHGLTSLEVHSQAQDRQTYLQRPDWGRRLDKTSVELLARFTSHQASGFDVAVLVADGLSALAVERHAVPMVLEIEQLCQQESWRMTPVIIARQARVALADEVGELLNAAMVVMLIGERPGLSSPDSLGIYFTWAPKVGLTDAARNCISNIRLEGLSYPTAAHRLGYLMRQAKQRQFSGVNLKDEAELPLLEGTTPAAISPTAFLLADDE